MLEIRMFACAFLCGLVCRLAMFWWQVECLLCTLEGEMNYRCITQCITNVVPDVVPLWDLCRAYVVLITMIKLLLLCEQ